MRTPVQEVGSEEVSVLLKATELVRQGQGWSPGFPIRFPLARPASTDQWSLQCGPWTNSISIPWELPRNTSFLGPNLTRVFMPSR